MMLLKNEKADALLQIIREIAIREPDIISELTEELSKIEKDSTLLQSRIQVNRERAKNMSEPELKQHIQESIANSINMIIEKKNISTNYLAKQTNTSANTIASILNKRSVPILTTFVKLHLISNIPLELMLFNWQSDDQDNNSILESDENELEAIRKEIELLYSQNGMTHELEKLMDKFHQLANREMVNMTSENLNVSSTSELKEKMIQSIAQTLKKQREIRGLSRIEMAVFLDTPIHAIVNAEKGLHLPQITLIAIMSYKFKLPFESILFDW